MPLGCFIYPITTNNQSSSRVVSVFVKRESFQIAFEHLIKTPFTTEKTVELAHVKIPPLVLALSFPQTLDDFLKRARAGGRGCKKDKKRLKE